MISTPTGWNPLLGIRPTTVLEALEELAKSRGLPWQLVAPPGPKNNRWPFRHAGDGLVHALLPLYRTSFWQVSPSGYAPVEAITECGVLALLEPEQHSRIPRYDSGSIAPEAFLTCLRCATGVDREGLRYRQFQKERAFGVSYGMDPAKMSALTGTNRPNMQQVPRKR